MDEMIYRICQVCEGKKVTNGHECHACNGTGFLSMEITITQLNEILSVYNDAIVRVDGKSVIRDDG